tara:strand:+ start:694 stop:1404 length:711 start_codon:yes stop_codon:yes gene_type:complete
MAFKMKGSSLYGKLNLNRGGNANRPDGRAKSSAFQKDEEKNEWGETPEEYKQRMIDMGLRKSDVKEEIDSKENKKASKRDSAAEKSGAPLVKSKEARMRDRLERRTKKGKGPKVNVRSANLEDKINKKYPKKNVEESFGPSNSNSKTYLHNDPRFKDMDRNPDGTKKKPGAPAIWPFKKKVKTSGAVLDRERKKKARGKKIKTSNNKLRNAFNKTTKKISDKIQEPGKKGNRPGFN